MAREERATDWKRGTWRAPTDENDTAARGRLYPPKWLSWSTSPCEGLASLSP